MADRTVRVRLQASIAEFQQGMRRASQETRQFGSQFGDTIRRNEQSMTRVGIAAMAMGGAILLGLRSAGREASKFEATITKLSTQIGLTSDEVAEMGRAAIDLRHTGRGPQELGDAMFFAASAGLRGSAAMDAVEASAKAASIGMGDVSTIVDLTTSAMNAYGSEVLSAEQATDILVGAVREGKAEAPELAGALGQVLPIASEMGIAFDEVGAALAAQTRTGTNAAVASTQLRAIMVSLLRPTGDSAAALEEFGLSAEGVRATIREDGLWQALVDIREAVGDNEEGMARIFPNIRALAGVLDLTGANAAETAQIFENMTDTTGLLNEGFAEWGLTTEAAQQRFSASMQAAKISLGQTILPAMMSMLERGTALLDWFSELDDETQQAVGSMGLLAGGFLTVGGASMILLPRLLTTIDAVRQLRTQFVLARGLMGPWGAAIGGTALVLWAFNKTLKDAREQARDFVAELEASGATAGETAAATRGRIAELQSQLDDWSTERFQQGMRASETPVRELRDELEELEAELARVESGFFDLSGQVVTGTGPALARVVDETGDLSDELRQAHPEIAAAIDELAGLEDGAEGTVSALDGLTDAQRRAAAALAPMPYYPMEAAS